MPQVHLADETLMAYADGELSDAVIAAVEVAMRTDPSIPPRITGFIRSRQLTRQILGGVDASGDLAAMSRTAIMILDRTEQRTPQSAEHRIGGPQRRLLMLPMAAAILLAAAAGYLASGLLAPESGGSTGPMAGLESGAVSRVLTHTPSGADVGTPSGRVKVVSTYRAVNGDLCREFGLNREREAINAIACRTDDRWTVKFAVAIPPRNGSYTPARGDDLTDLFLERAGLGAPLAPPDEAAALK